MDSSADQPKMNVLITGAGGFIGQLLAAALVPKAAKITLTDITAPSIPKVANGTSSAPDSHVTTLAGEPHGQSDGR